MSTSTSKHHFELFHVNIWGPYKTPTLSGAKYFLTVVKDFQDVPGYFCMTTKSETPDLLIKFYNMASNQF